MPKNRRGFLVSGFLILCLLGGAIIASSCAGGSGGAAPTVASSTASGNSSSGTSSGSALPPELRNSDAVRFESEDGVRLEGRLFGQGTVGVVLSHIADQEVGQAEWFSLAPVLVGEGYRVLTFNFRGFCPGGDAGCSDSGDETKTWLDVAAAVDFLREHGAETVFVVGAGLGGHVALYAASRPGQD